MVRVIIRCSYLLATGVFFGCFYFFAGKVVFSGRLVLVMHRVIPTTFVTCTSGKQKKLFTGWFFVRMCEIEVSPFQRANHSSQLSLTLPYQCIVRHRSEAVSMVSQIECHNLIFLLCMKKKRKLWFLINYWILFTKQINKQKWWLRQILSPGSTWSLHLHNSFLLLISNNVNESIEKPDKLRFPFSLYLASLCSKSWFTFRKSRQQITYDLTQSRCRWCDVLIFSTNKISSFWQWKFLW